MKTIARKFLKLPLVLVVFIGFVFSISCAFYHTDVSAHTYLSEDGIYLTHGSGTNCGTDIAQNHTPMHSECLMVQRETYRHFIEFLVLILTTTSLLFGWRFFDDILSRLSEVYTRYLKNNPELSFFNYLKLAFSRGILNSKKYHLAYCN